MKQKFLLPIYGSLIITFTIACQKGIEKPNEEKEKVSIIQSPKWNTNDDKYVESIKKFAQKYKLGGLNRTSTYCIPAGCDSSYGWYSDPDSMVVPGPYVMAKAGTYDDDAAACPSIDTLVADASNYLTSEGYSDIVALWEGSVKRHWLIHAANALVDIKEQYNNAYYRSGVAGRQTTVWHCLLEALGGAALAEIATNWATMSRTALIKAVGKLAAKHLNWVGAIVAVVTFVDCMWG